MEVVQSIDRALSILELISSRQEGMGVVEISDHVGLHKSTVHRLLGTLIYKGYVVQQETTGKYCITLKLYELGSRRLAGVELLDASKPFTRAMMQELNEVVHLVVVNGHEIVYVDKVEAQNTIRMASTIGRRNYMYCTSVGKAIMAQLPEEQANQIWERSVIEQKTDKTITSLLCLKKELKLIREQGYAEDDEENEIGIRCVGAPIFNREGVPEGAVSISGPAMRITKEMVPSIGQRIKHYANAISKELGYLSK